MKTDKTLNKDDQLIDVSIIIVNYNSGQLLGECLSSIFNYSQNFRFNITVFDNASTDKSLDGIADNFPKVIIIRGSKNLGFAQANNEAIVSSEPARYYLLLNSDTIIRSNAIKTMIDFMDAHPRAGISGPKILLANGKLDSPCRRSFKTPAIYLYNTLGLSKLFPNSKRFGRYYLSYLNENLGCEVDSVIGAFLLIRKQTIDDIGLLDSSFYVYGEDEDWCWRAKKSGWKIFYNPEATILHLKGASTQKRKFPMIFQWHKAAYLFHHKNLAGSYYFIINWLVYLGIAVHLGASMFFNLLKLGRKKQRYYLKQNRNKYET